MRLCYVATLLLLLLGGTAQAASLRIGDPVPPIRLTDLAGNKVDTGGTRGRTVVIYFWNDRCGCTEQLIKLRGFIEGLKGKPFELVTVNEGQGKNVAATFIKGNALPYRVLLDDDLKVGTKQFGIKVLPTIFIAGKDGKLREKLIGVVDSKRLESIIRRHL
ncbi:TlpA family protein disulfide reductase [Geomesophilobacter sediminis]|uniref:TlpA family protein disulfide reductase n=1 Tax=Geomesophilobacter sediminis TaxID=2798584 RepID=A0A8J7JIV5_9BACT|nr:TlpA disulfide reductase family protein [Geomesophilobacter sediminis]MBJ6724380.1 TlpA family protein disulfide reductase [Geomesophilobacter sediminis]